MVDLRGFRWALDPGLVDALVGLCEGAAGVAFFVAESTVFSASVRTRHFSTNELLDASTANKDLDLVCSLTSCSDSTTMRLDEECLCGEVTIMDVSGLTRGLEGVVRAGEFAALASTFLATLALLRSDLAGVTEFEVSGVSSS
jgi:hypothetical protein